MGDTVYIDGSYGEGGGQILRTSLSLGAILGREVEINNIRTGRKNPGLSSQHLISAEAVAKITGGELIGAELGSQKIRLIPRNIKSGEYLFDVAEKRGSAGSTGMVFQTLAPILAFAKRESIVCIKGGTHTKWSPPIDYIREVFLPVVERTGFIGKIETVEWGWYPKGGGKIKGTISPIKELKSLDLIERGSLKSLTGLSVVSNLSLSIVGRQKNRVKMRLKDRGIDININIMKSPSKGKGTFVFILAEFENSLAGFSSLGERGKSAEKVADEAVVQFLAYYDSKACIDPYLSDQLILYMVLASGRSQFTCSKITRHLLTNIRTIQKFLPKGIKVNGKEGERGSVSVKGVGWKGKNE